MITLAEAGKLGAVHTVHPGVLSLYLAVPLDPAELHGLPARVDDLIAAAESAGGGRGHVSEEDRRSVLERLKVSGRDWLGRTVAMFACADAGLSEAHPLPCRLPDRAVLGIRPHIRPLLAAIEQCPAHWAAVVDRRYAWWFHVADHETEIVPDLAALGARAEGPAGGHGLEANRVQQAARLAHHHFRDTAVLLEKAMAQGEPEPLVIGGHDEGVRQLLASLPPGIRDHFAGSFAADVRTLTAARVQELAAPLVARWAGLRACLAAVNACAVQILIVPDEGLVHGYECGRCGALSIDADGCPDWGTAALRVPDVIEEMVTRTLEDGGRVCPAAVDLSRIAARLSFPVAQ